MPSLVGSEMCIRDRVMELLWEGGDMTAKKIAKEIKEQVGWSKTTTYTVIRKCLDKGAIERIEPDFVCRPLVTRQQIQESETANLIDKMYNGATDQLVASLLGSRKLTSREIERLKQLVSRLEADE